MELLKNHDPNNVFYRCVEDCNEAIMLTDAKGSLVYVNPAWLKIYGFTKEEALNSTPRLLHSGYHSPEFYQKMWSEILDQKIGRWKGEVINRSKAGKLIPIYLTITPVKNQLQQTVGYMGIALDISAEKELEAKVLQQDRLASVGVLASGLAHEVGTPLGVIRGRAEFLMMQASESSIVQGLQVIVSQIDRISKLIQSLLRFSRANQEELTLKPVALARVVDDVLSLIAEKLKKSNIEFKREFSPLLQVQADSQRLEQIFMNLLVNAIHAIESDQKNQNTNKKYSISMNALTTEKRTAIQVTDNGTGINPENMKKLFQPFFTTKDIGSGTGLGLAIVYKLVHEMGGEIDVQSIEGQGSTFIITLHS